MSFQTTPGELIPRSAFLPPARIARWVLPTIAVIGLASTARAQTTDDIPLPSTTYIDSYYNAQNLGGGTTMKNVVNAPAHNAEGSSVTRSLLSLPSIPAPPAGDAITSVTLNLYCTQYNTNGDTTTNWSMVAYPLKRGFVQGNGKSSNGYNPTGATWYTYDGSNDWTTPGGDFDSSVSVPASATPVINSWTTFDLTSIWTNPSLAAQKQELQNYGVELTVSPENPNLVPAYQWVTESFANDNYTPPPTPCNPYLAVTFTPLPRPPTAAWKDISGNWSNPANWNPGTPPNAAGAVAEFLGNATQNRTATVDSPITVGTILFDNAAHDFTLAGSGGHSITMNSLSGAAAITVNHGSHEISAPIALASDTTVTAVSATDALTLSGNVGGAGGLTLAGSGALFLSGENSYDGGTTVDSGALYATDSEALPDGTSLTVGAGGMLIFDPTAAAAPAAGFAATTVPEPGTAALLVVGAGFAALAMGRRRLRDGLGRCADSVFIRQHRADRVPCPERAARRTGHITWEVFRTPLASSPAWLPRPCHAWRRAERYPAVAKPRRVWVVI